MWSWPTISKSFSYTETPLGFHESTCLPLPRRMPKILVSTGRCWNQIPQSFGDGFGSEFESLPSWESKSRNTPCIDDFQRFTPEICKYMIIYVHIKLNMLPREEPIFLVLVIKEISHAWYPHLLAIWLLFCKLPVKWCPQIKFTVL